MTLLGLAAVLSLPFVIPLRLLGCGMVLIYGAYLLQSALLRSTQSILGISKRGHGWQVSNRVGEREASLRGDSTVTSLVSILRFKTADDYFPRSCVIFRDSLAQDEYRRLMVVLGMS